MVSSAKYILLKIFQLSISNRNFALAFCIVNDFQQLRVFK